MSIQHQIGIPLIQITISLSAKTDICLDMYNREALFLLKSHIKIILHSSIFFFKLIYYLFI